jgi:hypothetical protein
MFTLLGGFVEKAFAAGAIDAPAAQLPADQ